jgi:hypothetical protein
MLSPHIVRKTTNPTGAPPEAGIHWINTVTNEEFFSVGTSSIDDWIARRRTGFRLYTVTVTAQNVSDKFLVLPYTPVLPDEVIIVPAGGIQQLSGIDFEVSGNILSWDTLGLDGFLEINDVLIVQH